MTRVLAKHPYRDIQSPWWKACVGPQEQETARLSAPSQPNSDCYKEVPPSQRSKPCLPCYKSGSSLSKPTRAEASTIFPSSNSSRNAGVYRPCPTNYFIKTLFCQAQVPRTGNSQAFNPWWIQSWLFHNEVPQLQEASPSLLGFWWQFTQAYWGVAQGAFLCMGYSSL